MFLDDAPTGGSDTTAPEASDSSVTSPATSGSEGDAPSGQPRDERGRYAPSEGTGSAGDPDSDPADDLLDSELDDAPASADADSLDDDAADPEAAPTDPAAEKAPTAQGEPFSIRVRGEQHLIEGAQLVPGQGLVVAEAALPRVQQLLARGRDFEVNGQRQVQELQRAAQEAEHRYDERVTRGQAIASFFDELLEQGPTAVADWLSSFAQNRPLLEARIERSHAQALFAAAQRGELPGEPEAQEEGGPVEATELARHYGSQLIAHAATAQAVPELRELQPADRDAVLQALDQYAPLFMRPANEQEQLEHGFAEGQEVFDSDRWLAELRRQVIATIAPRKAEQRARTEAQQREAQRREAAKRNALRTQGAGNGQPRVPSAPPTPTGASSSGPKPTPSTPTKGSWRETMGLE